MTEPVLQLDSPAKINIFLKITGRRNDGFHELDTLFHFLNCMDSLTFSPIEGHHCTLSCNMPELEGQNNLILQAATCLAAKVGIENPAAYHIHLDKYLPMEGGVGGGSSNAATTLLALNYLWKTGLSLDELAEIGLALGADVPVFVRGKSAIGRGRGELLQAFKLPEFYYLLLKPRTQVSTQKLFNHKDLTRDSNLTTIRAFPTGVEEFQGLKDLISLGNDCQNLVRKLHPEIDKSLELLSQYSEPQLTGTGACVFAPFETQDSAERAQAALQENPVIEHSFVAKGLNLSPVHQKLGYLLKFD